MLCITYYSDPVLHWIVCCVILSQEKLRPSDDVNDDV